MSFGVEARMDFPRAIPALLIRIVGCPTWARICVAAEAMAVGEVISHL